MPTLKDLTGQKFGKLTVVKRGPNQNKKVQWECICDCGNTVYVRSDQLLRGITKSCGCLHKQTAADIGHKNFKDLTGQQFGKLTALYPIKSLEDKKYRWICQCECGNIVEVLGTSLTNGNTKSCGCLKSTGETNIAFLLTQLNIPFSREYKIIINAKTYRFDFAIYNNEQELQMFIEFDGIQHYGRISGWFTEERWEQLKANDEIKNKYCQQHNIPLIRIPYWELDNIDKEYLMNKITLAAEPDMEEAQEIQDDV